MTLEEANAMLAEFDNDIVMEVIYTYNIYIQYVVEVVTHFYSKLAI